MKPYFTIRPIVDSDLEEALEVYRQSEDFLALGPDPRASLEMVARDRALSRAEGGRYCGIFLADKTRIVDGGSEAAPIHNPVEVLVGILDYTPHYTGDPGAVFIELLMLAAPYRGRGLGEAVVNELPSLLGWRDAAAGRLKLSAAVQVNNPAALRFWQRLGLRITGPPALQPDGTVTFPVEKIDHSLP